MFGWAQERIPDPSDPLNIMLDAEDPERITTVSLSYMDNSGTAGSSGSGGAGGDGDASSYSLDVVVPTKTVCRDSRKQHLN